MLIRNVYCVGRNYRMHALELGNEVPTEPMIFTKPTHALIEMDGHELVIPKDQGEVHFELEVVVQIGPDYVSGMKANEAIHAYTLGLDLTLRDVQSNLKQKGLPWLPAKGFKQSASLGAWLPFTTIHELEQGEFVLLRNGEQAQIGHPKDMIFGLDELVTFIDLHYGLGAGDLIYTGTPAGVAALYAGDRLEASWNGQTIGICTIA